MADPFFDPKKLNGCVFLTSYAFLSARFGGSARVIYRNPGNPFYVFFGLREFDTFCDIVLRIFDIVLRFDFIDFFGCFRLQKMVSETF